MSELQVELVAADRLVWSGPATMVIARTPDGDLGILPGHQPVLALLAGGSVSIRTADGPIEAAAHGGFLSVADNRVSILAESAELAADIDVARAEKAADRARTEGSEDDLMRAETRIRVAAV